MVGPWERGQIGHGIQCALSDLSMVSLGLPSRRFTVYHVACRLILHKRGLANGRNLAKKSSKLLLVCAACMEQP